MRLAGWLAARRHRGTEIKSRSFGEAARAYQSEGAFVDWARGRLWDGDSSQPLADAYTRLAQVADEARHDENRAFGALLATWPGSDLHDRSPIGVEEVLDRWVAPLARMHPVLLLVIDAMSMPVFRELEHDLAWRGWVELVREEAPERATVIAGLPTVTEVSRTSLLCGTLKSWKRSDGERRFLQARRFARGVRAERTAGGVPQGRSARRRRRRAFAEGGQGHRRAGPACRGCRDQCRRRPSRQGRPGTCCLDRAAHLAAGRAA